MKDLRNIVLANFFKDREGRVVIWQRPNAALYGWLLCKAGSMSAATTIKDGFANVGMALLFTWAYMEVVKGASSFRRALGLVVISMVVIAYFI